MEIQCITFSPQRTADLSWYFLLIYNGSGSVQPVGFAGSGSVRPDLYSGSGSVHPVVLTM